MVSLNIITENLFSRISETSDSNKIRQSDPLPFLEVAKIRVRVEEFEKNLIYLDEEIQSREFRVWSKSLLIVKNIRTSAMNYF